MEYRLTKVVPVHGCSCKLPQYELGKLLDKAGLSIELSENILAGPGKIPALLR